ncbi:out at first protein-like [Argonauta hians]
MIFKKKKKYELLCVVLGVLLLSLSLVSSELVVNVKNKGGDVQVESIDADTTANTISMQFVKIDGTHIYQFIDFKSEIQIFRAVVLPEEEQGQLQHQEMCFVMHYLKNEFISSDAMSKLRQKNSRAIRTPEDDKGREIHNHDLIIHLDQSHLISPYIYNICRDANDKIYAQDVDLRLISRSLGKDYNLMKSATKQYMPSKFPRCRDISDSLKPCSCQFEICVGWYPCGLKYCRGNDSLGHLVSYRCGIKTCRKCHIFKHYKMQKSNCMWDI